MLIKSKKELKEVLEYESIKYFGRKYKLKDFIFSLSEKNQIFLINYYLRKYEYHLNTKHRVRKIIYSYLFVKHKRKYGIEIPINRIDKGFKIMHLGPIMINAQSIGKDFIVHRGVEIVAGGTNDLLPKIGDNVICFVSSTICGGVEIGDNTVIGANSLVNKSFKEGNCLIGGVPAKILKSKINFDELFSECNWKKKQVNARKSNNN